MLSKIPGECLKRLFKRHNCILTICIILFTLPVFPQTAHVSGKVTQVKTGHPLSDVNVILKETLLGATTNKFGEFTIINVPTGYYTIVISRIGYQTVESEIDVPEESLKNLSFSLSVKPVELQAAVVVREMLTGGPMRINSIPGSVHYIGPEELETHSYNDINRALRKLPGINLQEEDGYGLRPNIGFRGTGVERSQKITIMEDGILIAPAPYSAPAAYYFPTVGRMQGIEIRKGSSQIKYGPYTTGGALNLISSQIPEKLGGYAKVLAGKDNTRTVQASVGNAFQHFGFLLETYQARSDGFKQLDNGANTGFDKKDYLAKFRINSDSNAKILQELTLKISKTDELSNETYLGLTNADFALTPFRRYAGSQRDLMDAQHKQYSARYFIKPSSIWDFTANAYRNEFRRNWYKLAQVKASENRDNVKIAAILEDPDTFFNELAIISGNHSSNENVLAVKANNRSYFSQGLQTLLAAQFEGYGVKHQLEIGLRYHQDEMDRFQWVDEFNMLDGVMRLTKAGKPGTESNRIESASVWSSFVQYQIKYKKFTAVPGVRYENIIINRNDYGKDDPQRTGQNLISRENKTAILVPGLGIDYQFNQQFRTFGGIHKGFSPPGSTEGARPEESINYELGFRFHKNTLNIEPVFFYNDYSNLLGADLSAAGGNGSGDLFNGGAIVVKGVELSANYDLGRIANANYAIPLHFAYTYTSAKFKNNFKSEFEPWGNIQKGDELPYLPKHQLFTGAGLLIGKWSLDVGAKFTHKIRTIAGQGKFIPTQSADAHTVLDASVEYRVFAKHTVFATVKNLTDAVYIAARRPAGIRPGLPRTFMVGIRSTF